MAFGDEDARAIRDRIQSVYSPTRGPTAEDAAKAFAPISDLASASFKAASLLAHLASLSASLQALSAQFDQARAMLNELLAELPAKPASSDRCPRCGGKLVEVSTMSGPEVYLCVGCNANLVPIEDGKWADA